MYYVKYSDYDYTTKKREPITAVCKNLTDARKTAMDCMKYVDAEYIHIYTKSNGRLVIHSLVMWIGAVGSWKYETLIPESVPHLNCAYLWRKQDTEYFIKKDGTLSKVSWITQGIM